MISETFKRHLFFPNTMRATIVNYRMSRHVQKHNHMVVTVEGLSSKDNTPEYIGKTVTWKSPAGKEIKGKVTQSHGNKGALRVIFEKGMPGQAVGSKVEIN